MKDFEVIDSEQRSDAWRQARLGRLTGSVASDMLSAGKGSAESAGRRNLRVRLVLERLTGRTQESDFVSPAMQAGIEREKDAFAAFEALTGDIAHRSGFLSHTAYMAGASLDGHIGDFETLLSIKCRQPSAHLDFLKRGAVPSDALAQMLHELWITGAQEHRYFSWNPDFPPSLQSRVVVMARDEAAVEAYQAKALAFLAEVALECDVVTGLGVIG